MIRLPTRLGIKDIPLFTPDKRTRAHQLHEKHWIISFLIQWYLNFLIPIAFREYINRFISVTQVPVNHCYRKLLFKMYSKDRN